MNVDSVTFAAVVGGSVQGPASFFTGYSIDSRTVVEGELFVAVKGPNHDGHDFLAPALEKAAGALVSRHVTPGSLPPGKTLIRVPETLAALRSFARYVRETLRFKVVGITGSVGKTTTKEMTAALVAQRHRVSRSGGNLNNAIGLPLEVARIPERTEVAVLEMGMSTPGEIRLLSELVHPDVGVVTAVAPVHLMNFPSLDGIQEAKAEILAGMTRESVFVANADDERVLAIAARHRGRVLRYGLGGDPSTLHATATGIVEGAGESRFTLHLGGSSAPAALPVPGRHNLANFLAAASAASALGVSLAEIVRATILLTPARHRGEVLRLGGDLVVYDDSYNSSPAALHSAFAAFESMAQERRRVAVVGEMLELGRKAGEFHREAGKELARRCDVLVAVRGEAAALAAAARRAGAAAEAVHFAENVESAIPLVRSLLRPGDALFVKGSRGVALDLLVDALAGEGTWS